MFILGFVSSLAFHSQKRKYCSTIAKKKTSIENTLKSEDMAYHGISVEI